MARVTLIQVVWNSMRFIPHVFPAVLRQTYKDSEFVAVIAGNKDGSKEYIQKHFPLVKIIDPGYNIGFSGGHNLYFAQSNSEFFQMINPDLIMEENYVEEMLKVFNDPKVGAATGKLLRYDFENMQKTDIIDTTGVIAYKTGRAKDRGQHETDRGQYDSLTNLIAVSGAGAMYRKTALEDVKYARSDGSYEYFDADFHSYWEDVDLGWRMVNRGWKCVFAPKAIAYHGRQAGSSPGGYKKFFAFVKFHKKFSPWVRQLNYKNHIFLFIKNSPKWYLKFFFRELFMFAYILVFETSTLKILPLFFKQLPSIWRKRAYIKASRKIDVSEIETLLNNYI